MRDLRKLALLIERSNRNLWWGNHMEIWQVTPWGVARFEGASK